MEIYNPNISYVVSVMKKKELQASFPHEYPEYSPNYKINYKSIECTVNRKLSVLLQTFYWNYKIEFNMHNPHITLNSCLKAIYKADIIVNNYSSISYYWYILQ